MYVESQLWTIASSLQHSLICDVPYSSSSTSYHHLHHPHSSYGIPKFNYCDASEAEADYWTAANMANRKNLLTAAGGTNPAWGKEKRTERTKLSRKHFP